MSAAALYSRNPVAPDHAEIGFVTAPAFQGRGIATRLLEALAEIARRERIHTFDAFVPPEDDRMVRVLVDSGFGIDRRVDAGAVHVVLSLEATPGYEERAAVRSEVAAGASMRVFFEPASVVVVGANRERGKIGAEVLHNVRSGGFTGRLAAVHPSAGEIDGVPAYPRVTDVPGDVDLAVICVPAEHVNLVADDCIAKGVRALVVISAGFAEIGATGRARETALVAKVREAGIRLVGPNCMGLLNTDPAVRLNATFAPVNPPAGKVAMSTQSGALGLAILDYARQLHIGLSTFVSVGNKADVSSNDLIQYWAADPRTDVILLYVESFGNPRKFGQIARRIGRRKPIVAVKSGRSTAGARAASSHTGALASSDVIVEALFRQAGVIRTTTLEELFDVAALLANQPVPAGRRVAILTNAGGPAILAADACESQGLELPALSAGTVSELRSFLPPAASVGNPVDMIASASAEQYGRALRALLADERVDSVLVVFIPPLVTRGDDAARQVLAAAEGHAGKPVLGIFMSTESPADLLAPIPCFMFPEAAAVALARAATYGEWLRAPEGVVPAFGDLAEAVVRDPVERALARGGGWLTPGEAQRLLVSARIPVAASEVVSSEDAAAAAADRIGYPVALKAIGPEIVHKTEVGGVRLGLASADDVRAAWREMHVRLSGLMTGGLVQQMVAGGVEMLIGVTQDPTFGPVLACASGGTMAELTADSEFRLHPLSDRDAAAMIDGLRGARLLRGFRGAPPADEGALRDALLRLSAVVSLCPEIEELDINPIVVRPSGAQALDVRVRVEKIRSKPLARRVTY